jgi:dipeptidyl aminopeptidase/acylaminoacyl peptidase
VWNQKANEEVVMKKLIVLVCILTIFTSACGGQVAQKTETPTPIITSPPVPDETLPPSPGPTPTPLPTPTPPEVRILSEGEGMQTTGPWLIFAIRDGFWLVNHQGDEVGFMPIFREYYPAEWVVSPQGGLVAFVEGEPYFTMYLKVLSLQDYTLLQTIDLLSYEGEGPAFDNEEDALRFNDDRWAAVSHFAWSHDGSKLAFVGSHQGPTPDLYVYDVQTNKVARLTSGPTHATSLYWSPDDKYIYHAGVEQLHEGSSGRGNTGWTFYAARADGSGVTTVFTSELEGRGDEFVIDWYSDNQVIMDSAYWFCGRFDLRLVDIESGKQVTIWPDQYRGIGYNSEDKTALVWVSEKFFSKECGSIGESGLYLVSIPDGRREKVEGIKEENIVGRIDWNEVVSRFILFIDNKSGMLTNDGILENISKRRPVISPDGTLTAWVGFNGQSLSISDQDGTLVEFDVTEKIEYPTWSPDGLRLFFFLEDESHGFSDLYMAEAPDFEPVLVADNVYQWHPIRGIPTWVMP